MRLGTRGGNVNTGIIILGMHRSGTSLTAEIAYRWGAYAGTNFITEPNEANPRGYWEHRPLVELNDELLSLVHSSWKVPPTEEGWCVSPDWRRKAPFDAALSAYWQP